VASIEQLSTRLRAEIGDIARSFRDTFGGDGITTRFQLSQAPVQGYSLSVKVINGDNVEDISTAVVIEEGVGVLTLPTAPAGGTTIEVWGQAYRYFTDSEISYYINNAFLEHARTATDPNGSAITQIALLPPIEEYPLVLLASTMALYTLATDAAFDIDISSPDGVNIPRSERYRQVTQSIEVRKQQYQELCAMLGIGLYRIETLTLRRISRLTNRYVPIYRPQEVDDGSIPQRVRLSLPNYGDITPPSTSMTLDLSAYSGDDFSRDFQFDFDLTNFTPKGQIRLFSTADYAQVGPLVLGEFTFEKFSYNNNEIVDSLRLKLTKAITEALPRTSYYDIQLTGADGTVKTYLTGKIFTEKQVTK
jgi:hypothetical protein